MEIEAKFSTNDPDILQELGSLKNLASYVLSDKKIKKVNDTYFDTYDLLLRSAGYSLRRRMTDGMVAYNVKGLEKAEEGIHQRQEFEIVLDEDVPVSEWEDSEIKDLVLKIVDDRPLKPLFDINQTRTIRDLYDADSHIAELSLDDVEIAGNGRKHRFLEVEAELKGNGTIEELSAIVAALKDKFELVPDNTSKFERSLKLLGIADECSVEKFSLDDLFNKYDVERDHACRVAGNAVILFKELMPYHGLDESRCRLMEIMGLVHDVGVSVSTDLRDHHKVGRDILLNEPLSVVDETENKMVAWAAFLHKKKINPEKLKKLKTKPFGQLPEKKQLETLKLAAILRMADGLDYSRMESSIGRVFVKDDEIVFEIVGPGAPTDADRAMFKEDLWKLLFDVNVQFVPVKNS